MTKIATATHTMYFIKRYNKLLIIYQKTIYSEIRCYSPIIFNSNFDSINLKLIELNTIFTSSIFPLFISSQIILKA